MTSDQLFDAFTQSAKKHFEEETKQPVNGYEDAKIYLKKAWNEVVVPALIQEGL